MDLKDFAKMINGKQYGFPQFTKEEIQAAKDNGFVIVCGASDDLMEFEGAITSEGDCYEGGTVWFNNQGVIDGPAVTGDRCIEALWCDPDAKDADGRQITWSYKTDIPHETFMIYEDDEIYCRGIVFEV